MAGFDLRERFVSNWPAESKKILKLQSGASRKQVIDLMGDIGTLPDMASKECKYTANWPTKAYNIVLILVFDFDCKKHLY